MSFLHSSVIVKWFLAYTCRLPSKDTSIRLAFAATIHQIGTSHCSSLLLFGHICLIQSNVYVIESVAGSLPWKACPCLNPLCTEIRIVIIYKGTYMYIKHSCSPSLCVVNGSWNWVLWLFLSLRL